MLGGDESSDEEVVKIEYNFLDEKIDDKRKTVKALKILHIRQSQFQSMYDSGRHHKVS